MILFIGIAMMVAGWVIQSREEERCQRVEREFRSALGDYLMKRKSR